MSIALHNGHPALASELCEEGLCISAGVDVIRISVYDEARRIARTGIGIAIVEESVAADWNDRLDGALVVFSLVNEGIAVVIIADNLWQP